MDRRQPVSQPDRQTDRQTAVVTTLSGQIILLRTLVSKERMGEGRGRGGSEGGRQGGATERSKTETQTADRTKGRWQPSNIDRTDQFHHGRPKTRNINVWRLTGVFDSSSTVIYTGYDRDSYNVCVIPADELDSTCVWGGAEGVIAAPLRHYAARPPLT